LDELERFQTEWKEGPLSSAKKLERLKAFFRAAHIRRWIDEDPAAAMQDPKVTQRPTLPFTREEMTRILAATSIYPDKSGKTGRPNALRLRVLPATPFFWIADWRRSKPPHGDARWEQAFSIHIENGLPRVLRFASLRSGGLAVDATLE
jgi:hypothetical protein